MFKKTLICLDGSRLAEQILPHVFESCQRFTGEMILVHVISSKITIPPLQTIHVPPFVKDVEPGRPSPVSDLLQNVNIEPQVGTQLKKIEREQMDAVRYLESVAQPLRKKGARIKAVALEGEADKAILDYASANQASLIALTTHGKGGLKRSSFGRIALSILKQTELPVLILKPKE